MVDEVGSSAFQQVFRTRWSKAPGELHPQIGHRGFELPDIADHVWEPIPGGASNNWRVCKDSHSARSFASMREIRLEPSSQGNVLVFCGDSKAFGRYVIFGSGNVLIMIGSGLGRHPVNVHLFSSNHVFYFGTQSTSNTATFECGIDGSSIIVGEDCMFSSGIHARTHDHHSIVDMDTGASINPPGDIIFEPHVWVGQDAVIMKNVRVGFGAVIATRAVVTRDVPRQSIVGGVPAKGTQVKCRLGTTARGWP